MHTCVNVYLSHFGIYPILCYIIILVADFLYASLILNTVRKQTTMLKKPMWQRTERSFLEPSVQGLNCQAQKRVKVEVYSPQLSLQMGPQPQSTPRLQPCERS